MLLLRAGCALGLGRLPVRRFRDRSVRWYRVQDLAGGVVVHTTAGVAALVLAIMIGKRPGFRAACSPHQPVLVMVGASMLWVGWFGFNGGSPFAANGDAVAAPSLPIFLRPRPVSPG